MSSAIKNAVKGLHEHVSKSFDSLLSRIDDLTSQLTIARTRMDDSDKRVDDIASRLDKLENSMSSSAADNLSLRVDKIEESLTGSAPLPSTTSDVNSVINTCMNEIRERDTRKNNVIIFGFPEVNVSNSVETNTTSGSNLDDNENLKEFLSFLDPLINVDLLKFKRLGSHAQDLQSQRPVKVICQNERVAGNFHLCFLKHKRETTRPVHLKSTWMILDRTRMQNLNLSSLKSELQSRQLEGEKGLRTVFRRGNPVLIGSQPPSKSTVDRPSSMVTED